MTPPTNHSHLCRLFWLSKAFSLCLTAAVIWLAASTVARAQSNQDTLDWIGGAGESAWTSPDNVWDDVSIVTPQAVSISSSETNTYGFVFNGTDTTYGPGTVTPTTMSINAVLNTDGISFSPNFNPTNTVTIGSSAITSPGILAYSLNFSSGAVINDLNSSGSVTFTPTVSGGNNVLYFSMNGTTSLNPSAGSSIVLDLSVGDGTSSGSLTQSGAGTVVLAGSNTYSGATTVNAGTMMLTGGSVVSSATGTGALSVNNTGTVLEGNGVADSNTTIGAGAILSPGLGGNTIAKLQVGTNAIGSGLTIDGELRVDLVGGGTVAGVNNDQVDVTGNTTLNPTSSTLVIGSITNPHGLVLNQKFYLVLASGNLPVVGFFDGLIQGATITDPAGDTYTISYTDNGDGGTIGNDISLTVTGIVPEPSSALLILLGLAAGVASCRMARRKVADSVGRS